MPAKLARLSQTAQDRTDLMTSTLGSTAVRGRHAVGDVIMVLDDATNPDRLAFYELEPAGGGATTGRVLVRPSDYNVSTFDVYWVCRGTSNVARFGDADVALATSAASGDLANALPGDLTLTTDGLYVLNAGADPEDAASWSELVGGTPGTDTRALVATATTSRPGALEIATDAEAIQSSSTLALTPSGAAERELAPIVRQAPIWDGATTLRSPWSGSGGGVAYNTNAASLARVTSGTTANGYAGVAQTPLIRAASLSTLLARELEWSCYVSRVTGTTNGVARVGYGKAQFPSGSTGSPTVSGWWVESRGASHALWGVAHNGTTLVGVDLSTTLGSIDEYMEIRARKLANGSVLFYAAGVLVGTLAAGSGPSSGSGAGKMITAETNNGGDSAAHTIDCTPLTLIART